MIKSTLPAPSHRPLSLDDRNRVVRDGEVFIHPLVFDRRIWNRSITGLTSHEYPGKDSIKKGYQVTTKEPVIVDGCTSHLKK